MGAPDDVCGWHRVVAVDGKLKSPEPDRQRKLLEREGVGFKDNGAVDMAACRCDLAALT